MSVPIEEMGEDRPYDLTSDSPPEPSRQAQERIDREQSANNDPIGNAIKSLFPQEAKVDSGNSLSDMDPSKPLEASGGDGDFGAGAEKTQTKTVETNNNFNMPGIEKKEISVAGTTVEVPVPSGSGGGNPLTASDESLSEDASQYLGEKVQKHSPQQQSPPAHAQVEQVTQTPSAPIDPASMANRIRGIEFDPAPQQSTQVQVVDSHSYARPVKTVRVM